ncbi:MAG: PIN domain-containing protein [Rhodospirillaceae bacterium]|nr:PIN domain-containing protein [Rhodospirillaceae bacterium]
MRALLDVNVLIALLDVDHVHHEDARRWLRDNIRDGWATCPLTENGCVRIMAQPAYPNRLPPARTVERLRAASATSKHQFWPDDISLLSSGVVDWHRIVGPKQIADLYLLALAVERKGRLVTFDARIDSSAVPGAEDRHYCLI